MTMLSDADKSRLFEACLKSTDLVSRSFYAVWDKRAARRKNKIRAKLAGKPWVIRCVILWLKGAL